MKDTDIVKGFNAWMDESINDPKKFGETSETIKQHLLEKSNGEEPSYGDSCLATLKKYC